MIQGNIWFFDLTIVISLFQQLKQGVFI